MNCKTEVRFALGRLENVKVNGSIAEVLAAANVALGAGASFDDVLKAIGGKKAWQNFICQVKKAGLV